MWTCPICKTTNETNTCTSCGFDASRDYTTHRSLTELDISNFDISQIKEDYFSFEEYTGLPNLPNMKVK